MLTLSVKKHPLILAQFGYFIEKYIILFSNSALYIYNTACKVTIIKQLT